MATITKDFILWKIAGENLSENDAVYVSDGDAGRTAGYVYKQDVTNADRRVFLGFVKEAVTTGNYAKISYEGSRKGFTGLTQNDILYGSTTTPGGYQTTKPSTDSQVVYLGNAVSATEIMLSAQAGNAVNKASIGGSGGTPTGTPNTVAEFNTSGDLTSSAITTTELGYLDNASSNIQTQLNGKVDLTSTQTISGSKTFSAETEFTSGINFGGTIGGNISGVTLDDYEEGTWTPALGGSSGESGTWTYSTQDGYYTKVGNKVTCTCFVQLTSIGTVTGVLVMKGLPFTVQANNGAWAACTSSYEQKWTLSSGHVLTSAAIGGTQQIYFYETDYTGDINGNLSHSNIENTTNIVLNVTYFTTA